jgi:glutathione S-transferase
MMKTCPNHPYLEPMPMNAVEIHGLGACPLPWQTRIAAYEKGGSFDWLPFDAADPDPRLALSNPARESPLLVHGHIVLMGAPIISLYLDEEFDGLPLQPDDPRLRAESRLLTSARELPGDPTGPQEKRRAKRRRVILDATDSLCLFKRGHHGSRQKNGRRNREE